MSCLSFDRADRAVSSAGDSTQANKDLAAPRARFDLHRLDLTAKEVRILTEKAFVHYTPGKPYCQQGSTRWYKMMSVDIAGYLLSPK